MQSAQPTLALSKLICVSTGVIQYANYEQLEADLIQMIFVILVFSSNYKPQLHSSQNMAKTMTDCMCNGKDIHTGI